jgi:PPOX class probable F420-dependent enzyme
METMALSAIPLAAGIRALFEAPNYAHLSTLRADGSPRNHVVWVAIEGDHILICTSASTWKARDMRRDARVALSVVDRDNPYRMAAVQGRVIEERSDEQCRFMDPISIRYTGKPFPYRGPDRVCFVVAAEKAGERMLDFIDRPTPPG